MPMKRIIALFLTTVSLLALTACGSETQPHQVDLFAMNTYMSLVAYGDTAEDALADCAQIINELESHISRTAEGSDIYMLNENGTATLSEQTCTLLQRAVEMSALTDGLFDITVAPLVSLWNIMEDPYVPTQAELDELLPLVGSEHIHIDGEAVTLDADCAVDLGGIGKGYASDLVKQALIDGGVESGTVSLGGNAFVLGTRPDGSLWSVGIQDPKSTDCAAYLQLRDAFVVTSGAYQRNFTAPDGTFYHHILDPRTGAPAQSDLTSVSIVCTDGTMADALSTALYIMGEADAIRFWRTHPELDFDIVLITADGRVCSTLPADQISLMKGSTYDFQAIS